MNTFNRHKLYSNCVKLISFLLWKSCQTNQEQGEEMNLKYEQEAKIYHKFIIYAYSKCKMLRSFFSFGVGLIFMRKEFWMSRELSNKSCNLNVRQMCQLREKAGTVSRSAISEVSDSIPVFYQLSHQLKRGRKKEKTGTY